jgi:hypothetical protein
MEKQDSNETLAETENLIAWRSREENGYVYHIELGPSFSLHLMADEWEELVILLKEAAGSR